MHLFLRPAELRRLLVASAALAALPLTAAPPGGWRPLAVRHFYRAELVAADALRPSERDFLDKAAVFTRAELRVARLAMSQAASADVREFAQQLASNQRELNDSIEALRRTKGAGPMATGDGMTPLYQQLAQKTGADFDREFVRQLAAAHADLLALFEQVLADAKDGDVRDLAGGALPMLRGDRNQLTTLKKTID